ncbi:hypothetical protein BDY21DRAFT_72833 [Lineolata rhizophorae]|uniref:Uncharacterized protein n=1 Tax=Lineolata rhizophorae TaxID=578093 RepID=A0A6A6NU42_9PEZI|nr:hypothetical protein BDY21DRAFT_72833 [Lineolata rhizophorae]
MVVEATGSSNRRIFRKKCRTDQSRTAHTFPFHPSRKLRSRPKLFKLGSATVSRSKPKSSMFIGKWSPCARQRPSVYFRHLGDGQFKQEMGLSRSAALASGPRRWCLNQQSCYMYAMDLKMLAIRGIRKVPPYYHLLLWSVETRLFLRARCSLPTLIGDWA